MSILVNIMSSTFGTGQPLLCKTAPYFVLGLQALNVSNTHPIIVTIVKAPHTFPSWPSPHWLPHSFGVSTKSEKPRSTGLSSSGGCFPTMAPCRQGFSSVNNVIREHWEAGFYLQHTILKKKQTSCPLRRPDLVLSPCKWMASDASWMLSHLDFGKTMAAMTTLAFVPLVYSTILLTFVND